MLLWTAKDAAGPHIRPILSEMTPEAKAARNALRVRLIKTLPRLKLAAPFLRFAIARLVLSHQHTVETMANMYVDRSMTEAPRRPTELTTSVTQSAAQLRDVIRLGLNDLKVLVRAEAQASDCMAGIASDWLETTLH